MMGGDGAIGNESKSEGQGLLLLLSLYIKRIQKVSFYLFIYLFFINFKNTPKLINLSFFHYKKKREVKIVN